MTREETQAKIDELLDTHLTNIGPEAIARLSGAALGTIARLVSGEVGEPVIVLVVLPRSAYHGATLVGYPLPVPR